MGRSTNKKLSLIWQSASTRLPSLLPQKTSRRGRRAKKLELRLGHFKLNVSLRYFQTAKYRRSQHHKQLIIGLPLPIKEVAVTFHHASKPTKHQPKLRLATLLIIFSLISAIFFGAHLSGHPELDIKPAAAQVKPAISPPVVKSLPSSKPLELKIPKINVDTQVAEVGLKPDGSLDVPADYHQAGWYAASPTPGEIGPSVIDGHVDNVNGLGVFWRLRELAPGDEFQVVRADGTTATFKVDSIDQFPQDGFPSQEVYGQINYAGVRLITCGGVFNTSSHHYSDNIVVFASLQ